MTQDLDPTNDELNAWAAEFLGWHQEYIEIGNGMTVLCWCDAEGIRQWTVEGWRPAFFGYEHQAMMVVRQMGELYGLASEPNTFTLCWDGPMQAWYCEFPLPLWESAEATTPGRAMVLAAWKAKGGQR